MSASLLARSALRRSAARSMLRQPQLQATRQIHIENTVGNNMPFDYTKSKAGLGFKIAAFMITGFSLPFVAAKYQNLKASGAA